MGLWRDGEMVGGWNGRNIAEARSSHADYIQLYIESIARCMFEAPHPIFNGKDIV